MGGYVPLWRRRRQGLTNYKARKKAVISQKTILAVRVSRKNVSAQFTKPQVKGDIVLASVHSRQLRKFKLAGSLKSIPACYLLGLAAGKKAQQRGIKEAVLYNSVASFISGSRIAAFVKGVVDAGIDVPVSKEVFPSEERLSGKKIGEYAQVLLKESKDEYQKRFSALLKAGFKPEEYPDHFGRVRQSILGGAAK